MGSAPPNNTRRPDSPVRIRKSSYAGLLESIRRDIRFRHIMTPFAEVFKPSGSTQASAVLKLMRDRDYDMAPVIGDGSQVLGYVLRKELAKSSAERRIQHFVRQFQVADIVSSNTSVLRHLRIWDKHEFFLVNQANKPSGIVTRADLNKAPIRLILYVLIAEIEAKLRRLIDRELPNESWLDYFDDDKKEKIDGRRASDKKSNLELDRLYYLEFSGLLRIVESSHLFESLGYTQIEFQRVKKSLNKLRIDVMHTKPLLAEGKQPYSVFRELLELAENFVGRIPVTSLKRTV